MTMLVELPDFIISKIFKNPSSLMVKLLTKLYRHPPLFAAHILKKLSTARFRLEFSEDSTISEYVDFSYSFNILPFIPFYIFSIKPGQKKEEITRFLKFIQTFNPKTVLEIGSSEGGTLFLLSRTVDDAGILISIDLLGGPFGGGYPEWKIPLYKSFVKKKQTMHLIRGNSRDTKSFEMVKRILDNKEVDLLFIDGDHTYAGVKEDFEIYFPLVKKGGMIAFHDIVFHPDGIEVEVDKFWNEVKVNFNHIEIVNKNQSWGGIGILFK